MTRFIKSGREQLDEFFAGVETIDGVDSATASVVKRLYEEDRLTSTNIANELSAILRGGDGDEDPAN